MRSSFLLVFVWLGLAVASLAATVTAVFTSATTIPVTAASYTATGNDVSLSLSFAPPTGTNLTVIKNTGLAFISGQFSNLVHGQTVNLSCDGITYKFVANYYGGSGNDLVLHWAQQDLAAWGSNSVGQLGNNSLTSSSVPVLVNQSGVLAGKTMVSAAAGSNHNLALCSDGTLAAWGYNSGGELGNNSTTASSVPVLVNQTGVLAGKTVVSVAAGFCYSLALCSDGSLAAWGGNNSGQLGNNSLTSSSVPVLVDQTGVLAGKTVVSVAAGASQSLALCSDGTLAVWGHYNTYWSGYIGTYRISAAPMAVGGSVLLGKMVVKICAGTDRCLVLCSDGTVVQWGNSYTSNGLPYVLVDVTNAGVLSGKTVVDISADQHCLALCSDGTLAAWGNNNYGKLGNNSTTYSSVPVLVNQTGVLAGKTVVSAAVGGNHSLALCSDGTLAVWGHYNS